MVEILAVQRRLLPVLGAAAHRVGDLDIAHGRERGQQVELLEDEADAVLAQPRALGVGERGKVHAVDHHAAFGGLRQPAQQVKERGLARARRADDGDKLARLDGQRNPAHGGDLDSARRVNLGQVFGKNDRRRFFGLHDFYCKCTILATETRGRYCAPGGEAKQDCSALPPWLVY